MILLPRFIRKTLSVRLSMMVVGAMALLLMASLAVMLHYARKAVKEEALQKAAQTLEATVERIDNVLLSVEQATGNIYCTMMMHGMQPEMMSTYSKQLVEGNPYVDDCTIAFLGDYADGDEPAWFKETVKTGRAMWLNPQVSDADEDDNEPVITFCLPLYGKDRQPIGVMGVDMSLGRLSRIVIAAKPSANSYCTLLAADGSFMVHPDSSRLSHHTVFEFLDQPSEVSAREAVQAMVSGETGYKPFRMNGADYYVFYRPFERTTVPGRSEDRLGWSVGIIYPEDDIFGDYNDLLYYVLAITVVGLLLLFVLCRTIIHRQLKPLLSLAERAQTIARGITTSGSLKDSVAGLDQPVYSRQEDEIGRLQDNFQQMQRSLATHIGELEQLKTELQARSDRLRSAYNQAQKADRMKTAFLHNMTNQMTRPSETISKDVDALCNGLHCTNPQERERLANEIQRSGHAIADLLNNLIKMSNDEN